MSERPALLVLVGPTASGKTALACALAGPLEAEVVNADSQQCYRGLDRGTAKPTAAERAGTPHHLLDVAFPEEQLDAAAFIRLADAAIADIHSRGKRAIVAGGTGLWIRALLRGLLKAPGADPEFRARFREELQQRGLPAMHARLAQVDPHGALAIREGDRVRIERALEVHALTGRPLSELQREHGFRAPRYPARVLLVDPPRELLFERIRERTAALYRGGEAAPLVVETRALLRRIEAVPAAARALKIIGYGETAAALAACETAAALASAEAATAARTRQYAKRQRTWFRKDAPALDALASPLPAPEVEALADSARGLCATLREWYEAAR